ncbi:sialate O-acetylesterase [Pedobacter yulinensis]|uniref:Sialate O-acetylesterase n=1 Tax=Pedobacter yulinensis TaxID=2126353 RepID=A0A2T3HMN0_9SPHI|nr:sialate O-acetylesterase [Pedobacter yulinensis]PST83694.1 sialate O-acetylesterase [Pedobacter yulinensis]
MLNAKRFLTGLIVAALALTGAATPERPQAKTRVYLLMGQSNMAGRGKVTAVYKSMQHPRVIMLNKNNQWTEAKHPVHFDKPDVAGVGPGLRFGMELAKAYPHDTIALVPCAVGGTSITKWEPGVYDKASKRHVYDDALARIRTAMQKGTVHGVIWLQGEADSGKDTAVNGYLSKLDGLIRNIRREVGNEQLPWVAGELGRYRQRYLVFNKELRKLPRKVANTAVVTSTNLQHKGDTTHLDSPSADLYGKRFARQMIRLERKMK